MLPIDFRSTRYYDYTPTCLNDRIRSIKSEFIKKCKNAQAFTDEYYSYISNPDNIKVTLKPTYGIDLFFESTLLFIEVGYSYKSSYVSSTTIKIEQGWDKQIWAEKVHDNYESYTGNITTKESWYPPRDKPCKMRVGNVRAKNTDLSQFIRITDASSATPELAKMINKEWFTDDFLRFVKEAEVPERAKKSLIEETKQHTPSANNFTFKIYNYCIDEADLTILPNGCPFDISVTFDGVKYEQKGVNEISEIVAKGQETSHHAEFVDAVNRLKKTYDPHSWTGRKLAIISRIIGYGTVLMWFVGWLTSVENVPNFSVSNNAFKYYIGLLAVAVFCTLLISPAHSEEETLPEDNEDLYSPSLTITALKNRVEDRFAEQENRNTGKLTVRFIIFLIIIIAIYITAFMLME